MITRVFRIALIFFTIGTARGQYFTSFFIGNTNNISVPTLGGVCLMGGATEDDEAMKWFLSRANGGDVLVLRASGGDGYNNYFYSELGVPVNSVETIRFDNIQANSDAYVLDKIKKAEAIWIAGGDQWNYISSWRNSPVDSLINRAIWERNIVIGGTSAGMAILGSHYFTAQNGTITSNAALQNPFNSSLLIDNASFIKAPYLQNVITDTHYDNPNRKGRHAVFMARFLFDYGTQVGGIACDEYTAVCIDNDGIARVFGGFPNYDDNAYFIQVNCELDNVNPEVCAPNQPLTWNRGGEILKVYQVKGTSTGSNTFDLKDWHTGVGGTWLHWSIEQGVFSENSGSSVTCFFAGLENDSLEPDYFAFPNPSTDQIEVIVNQALFGKITIFSLEGKTHFDQKFDSCLERIVLDVSMLGSGVYILQVEDALGNKKAQRIVKQ